MNIHTCYCENWTHPPMSGMYLVVAVVFEEKERLPKYHNAGSIEKPSVSLCVIQYPHEAECVTVCL